MRHIFYSRLSVSKSIFMFPKVIIFTVFVEAPLVVKALGNCPVCPPLNPALMQINERTNERISTWAVTSAEFYRSVVRHIRRTVSPAGQPSCMWIVVEVVVFVAARPLQNICQHMSNKCASMILLVGSQRWRWPLAAARWRQRRIYTVKQRKGTTFLLRISLFNMQCNSTKFSTWLLVLLVNIIIDVRPTHLISAIYTIICAPFYAKVWRTILRH